MVLIFVIAIRLLVVNVHTPKDRVTSAHQGYGFVEFLSEDDADYAIKILNMIRLFGKPIRVNKVTHHHIHLSSEHFQRNHQTEHL